MAVACIAFAVAVPATLAGEATRAESIVVAPGFAVERVHSANPDEGSWISMTFDNRGRIIVGRDDRGLMRLTLGNSGVALRSERINEDLKHCRGVLWAHDSLYVSATDSPGLYRLRDQDGDDRYETVKLLTSLDYRSRYGHGSNQITLGPDGQIYWTIGNDVSFPEGTSPESPYRDPREDHLLPNPHDAGQDRRVGYILRSDPEGSHWTVLAGGFRNPVDLAFNSDGEMFTFDADMEWDIGMPWYRPTRINHVIAGGEYGWRWGTGKWPVHHADSLPSSGDVGLGSPTGLLFGTRSRFPESYRRALFLADWQNGRILIARPIPAGCSYRCEHEVFLAGAPLNICDMEIGPDGDLYFITGGRDSQSGLYRVTWKDRVVAPGTPETEASSDATADPGDSGQAEVEARRQRRELEPLQTRADPAAVETLWPYLSSPDRWLRFAARVALERQDPRWWAERAMSETSVEGRLTALTALARVGGPEYQERLLNSALELAGRCEDDEPFLELLRLCQLSCIRQGKPSEASRQRLLEHLDARYPHADLRANQMLCELLFYLDAPNALGRTVDRMRSAASQEEQIHYADLISRHPSGWNPESRQAMVEWLGRSLAFRGGRLLRPNLDHIREDFLQVLSPDERESTRSVLETQVERARQEPLVASRPHVQTWSLETLLPAVEQSLPEASAERGRRHLVEAQCLRCHLLGNEGTPVGPDLTHVARRYDARSILQSVVHPSREIDPKYRVSTYELQDGRQVTGQIVTITGRELTIETDVVTGRTETVPRDAIVDSHPSSISPMPTGLLDGFTATEIADLLAYLQQTR